MIEFAWPYVFFALPLPILIRLIFGRTRTSGAAALRVPHPHEFSPYSGSGDALPPLWRRIFILLAWISLVTAATNPAWVGDPIELPLKGRDLLLAADLSGSMSTEDFQYQDKMIDRLTAVKLVAGEFIDRRVGDRIGLILFGRQAYLQTPLTFDRTTARTLLHEAVVGLAGKETAIGNAIGLAVKRLKDRDVRDKIVILLTDGANTAGEIEPLKAAELAAEEGLKIYTIGIGADEMIIRSFFGSRRVNPSADLDETTLKAIAEQTGGRYFRARDTEQLEEIYRIIDKLEPVEQDARVYRPLTALFVYPLIAALMATLLVTVIPRRRG
jgi:Ca-activated chloride channel family protein